MSTRRLLQDMLGMAASQYLSRAVLLVRGVVAAAALGPAGFGSWNALNLILDYGGYASCGALQGLDLRLPASSARGDSRESRRLLAGAWSMVVAGGGLFALAVLVSIAHGRPRILRGLGWLAPLLMLLAALLQLVIQYLGSALRARGRFDVVSGSTAAQVLLGGGLGILLVRPFGIAGLLWGWLAGTLVALIWARRATRDVPFRTGAPAGSIALVRGGFVVFAFFTVSLVLRSVDRLAFIRFGRAEDLGAYSVGLMVAGLVLHVPEAAAAVLYPRIVAAAGGARDLDRTRREVARVQRALALLLPLAVAVGMVWVAPVLDWWLPQFAAAAAAVRLLALAALLLSAATLPAYWLLGRGRARALLLAGALCAAAAAALVFGVAARAPYPAAVAAAACAGYAVFAVVIVAMAARDLHPEPRARLVFSVTSFLPAAWLGTAALVACGVGPPRPILTAVMRTAAVLIVSAPLFWWLGRGTGLRALARGRGREEAPA
jgi:O-antigen/teichoic acid export membrane protein